MKTYMTVLTRIAYFSLGVIVGILLYLASTQQAEVDSSQGFDQQQLPLFTTQSASQSQREEHIIDTAAISAALVERERARSYTVNIYEEQARLLQELEERVATSSLSVEQETTVREQIENLQVDQEELQSLLDELDSEIADLQEALDAAYKQAQEVIDRTFD